MTDKTRSDIRIGDLTALDGDDDVSAGARAPRPASPPGGAPVRVAAPGRRAAGWPVPVLAVVSLLLAGACGWLYSEVQRLSAAQAVLAAKQDESVRALETQVASTTTTLKSSDSQTQQSLNLVAADIRRLDDGLQRLARGLDAQGKAAGKTAADLEALAKSLRATADAQAQAETRLGERLRGVADTLEQQAARQKSLSDAVTRLERSGEVAQLRSELSVLGASLRESQQDHERRLKSAEQAIASNDAFRRQVNGTLDRLGQQVAELYGRR